VARKQQPISDLAPASVDAEQATLGSLLIDGSLLVRVSQTVKAAHFSRPAHGQIFAAMLAVARSGKALDLLTLAAELRDRRELESVGGPAYLTLLAERVPVATHAVHYATEVYQQAQRRALIGVGAKIAATAFDSSTKFEDVWAKVHGLLDEVDEHTAATESGSVEDAVLDLMAPRRSPWSTGIPVLDQMIGGDDPGLAPEILAVITGLSGLGKTWIATSLEVEVLKAGGKVMDVSLEMPRMKRVARIAAAWWGPEYLRLLRNPDRWTQEDHERFAAACGELYPLPLTIWHRQFDVRRIAALARIHQPDLVLIDYYQNLWRPKGRDVRSNDDADQVMSQVLQEMRDATGATVVVVSQLNKDGSMKYGGWLNNRCDLHLHMEPDQENTGALPAIKVSALKNRSAPDADAGAEEVFLMDKRRGLLKPLASQPVYRHDASRAVAVDWVK
jgi:replicative DNA helicase